MDDSDEFELDLAKLDIATLRAMQKFVSDEFGIILNTALIVEQNAEAQRKVCVGASTFCVFSFIFFRH